MSPTGNTRIYDGLPALILGFALVAMLAPVGCEQGSNVVEEGRYPPPDEGSTATVEIIHWLPENGREAESWAKVKVLIGQASSVDAEVRLDDFLISYRSSDMSYSGLVAPPFYPGSAIKLKVRSRIWGEDSTWIRLPESFDIEPIDPSAPSPGDTLSIIWNVVAFASYYAFSVSPEDDVVNAWVAGTLDTVGFRWVVPDSVSGTALVIVDAVTVMPNDVVFSGRARCRRERTITVTP